MRFLLILLEAVALYSAVIAGTLSAPWLKGQWHRMMEPKREGFDIEREAVRRAYEQVGLPLERFAPDVDLVPTGKLYEILYHASAALGKDHELRSVQDVIDWLREAPRKEPT